jgi:alpha-L-fucosidase 2
MGPTLDNDLLRDLFTQTAEAAHILGIDAPFSDQLLAACRRLPPDRIGKHGQVEEWLEDFDEPESTHRHLSSIYGFFPSNQITKQRDPKLVQAVRVTADRRADENLGVFGGWKINVRARLGDAEHAHAILNKMLTEISMHPGKEDSDRVPSIEGNQGIQGLTAGLAEMLLQSYQGSVSLLPALPKAWPNGRVEGLRARGGFIVDLGWRNGELTRARIRSSCGGTCRLTYRDKEISFNTRVGGSYLRNESLQPVRS